MPSLQPYLDRSAIKCFLDGEQQQKCGLDSYSQLTYNYIFADAVNRTGGN